jgi:hypothetical protein
MTMANADNITSGNLNETDRLGLRAMLAQMNAMSDRIRVLLGDGPKSPSLPDLIVQGTTPVSEPPEDPETLDKVENQIPMTEPTPPSTVGHGEGTIELD